MRPVKAILFEPVGCLAEFPAEPFNEIAMRFFGGRKDAARSGSRAYWDLLNLMQESEPVPDKWENLEIEAVNGATVYEDAAPAIAELKTMGLQLMLASSLSKNAVVRFLDKCSSCEFSGVWSRDDAGGIDARGIKDAPLRAAIGAASLRADETVFLTDTAEGLKVARSIGLNAVLMMNDPDEAKRLAMQEPAGGIVSLLELPDFVRLVAARFHAAG